MNPILAALIAVVLTACSTKTMQPETQVGNSLSSSLNSSSGQDFSSTSSERAVVSYDPVSLPALRENGVRGSNLELLDVLATNMSYTRYRIAYQANELTISGIINIPTGTQRSPLLILNHGYIDPAVYTNGRGLKREQDYLARQGFTVLHTDYRNHAFSDKDDTTEQQFRLGYITDAVAAVKAVKASTDERLQSVDTDSVGMLGHSMGGGVTLGSLIVEPDLIDAAVLFAPVSGYAQKNFDQWTVNRTEVATAITTKYGTTQTNPTFWNNVSPAFFYESIRTPVQIHHGTNDADVPLDWSNELQSDLQNANVPVEYFVYQNEPHEFINDWPLVMERTTNFFTEQLKDSTTTTVD